MNRLYAIDTKAIEMDLDTDNVSTKPYRTIYVIAHNANEAVVAAQMWLREKSDIYEVLQPDGIVCLAVNKDVTHLESLRYELPDRPVLDTLTYTGSDEVLIKSEEVIERYSDDADALTTMRLQRLGHINTRVDASLARD
jgi:hypothetical protein